MTQNQHKIRADVQIFSFRRQRARHQRNAINAGAKEQNIPMTNRSAIDVAPMEGVAEAGIVPTPATEALRIFMAHPVHSAAAFTGTGPTAASRHLRLNGSMDQQSCQRQVQHQRRQPPLPSLPICSEPLDMTDLSRATARVERRVLRKKRSSSTTSRNENAADEFPAIEWNSDDEGDNEDTYATNDDEHSCQEQEDDENCRGTNMSSCAVAVQNEGILKDEKAHQASPTSDQPIRKRRSGDALGKQACADTLHRAKSRRLGPKDADDATSTSRSGEECGCFAATTSTSGTSSSRPPDIAALPAQQRSIETSSKRRQQKSLQADSFMDIVANHTNHQASSKSQTATSTDFPTSITALPPSFMAKTPATAAFLAAALERVATSEDFTSLMPLPPSRTTSWGQFVSSDNLSPLPSPPSHHYNSSVMRRKGNSPLRSHTGLELKKAGSYCNAIASIDVVSYA